MISRHPRTRHTTALRRVTAAALGAALLLSVSACSAAVDDEAAAPAADQAFTTVTEGTLTCAMSGEYRPFNFYDESNELVGFDVDICNGIAEELGLEAEPVTGAFNSLIAGLTSDRYDAIIGSMSSTEERLAQVDFTESYYATGAELFVATDSSITDVADLKDATVGVALGTTFEEYARTLEGVSDVTTFQADIDALRDLEAGRVDAVITQGFMGRYLAKNADLKVDAVGDVLFPDVAAIPVNKENPELLDAINAALVTMHEDGTYEAISIDWFGEDIS
ncbi:amino acid ABC transporter substrate-binding protein [Cryobacterium melibiosiphilum]|uniref:Amino acid ABC transporter substrate-binding protein n=1 Tax=Cryobacterium melibiosiphilum TaxID=995039 RepID=A0A3A5MME7_9MICO|nr:transporter substrate-binding domain-containing protein [Cryobacterium melibiosiphilum]RJT89019.1 amino acid ABC transporter substrate-binding protein [Cryobacterium melibiosiphilum]